MTRAQSWSAPDRDGVCTLALDVGAASTLRGRRLSRAFPAAPGKLSAWPQPWRQLLTEWLGQGSPRRKWATLLRIAGNSRFALAHELLAALLRGGWVELEEKREQGQWAPAWLRFLDGGALRAALGLPDREALALQWGEQAARPLRDPRLQAAHRALQQLPPQRALSRLALLHALDDWAEQRRFGTRRDFSLFARGHTKAVTSADWDWLEGCLDSAAFGVERHTPALWLRAPLTLYRGGARLDLAAVEDCIALTPDTVAHLTRIEGGIGCWRVLENRTSFERAARRYGAADGVLWLPGFAPEWWRAAVGRLLALCPAGALIACDPDPAGIEIALQSSALWQAAGLPWQPWGMDIATLAGLRERRPLSQDDRERLGRLMLQPLPGTLQALARWMLAHGEKGEQEGAL